MITPQNEPKYKIANQKAKNAMIVNVDKDINVNMDPKIKVNPKC